MSSEVAEELEQQEERRKGRKVHFAENAESCTENKIIGFSNNKYVKENVELEKEVSDASYQECVGNERWQDKCTEKKEKEVNRCETQDNVNDNNNSTTTYSYHSTVNAIEDKNDELAKLLEQAAREREIFDRERQETACLRSKRKKQCSSQRHQTEESNDTNKAHDNSNDRTNKKKKPKTNVKANNRSNFTHFRNKDFTPKASSNDKYTHKKTDKGGSKMNETVNATDNNEGYHDRDVIEEELRMMSS